MLHLSRRPQGPLVRFVDRLWIVAGGQSLRQERILPSGTIELVVNLSRNSVTIDRRMNDTRARTFAGAVVSGPYSGAFVIGAVQHESMIGVHFRPGGAFAMLGVSAAELADAHVNLDAIWGRPVALELRERLCEAASPEARLTCLERALSDRLLDTSPAHPAVRLALERFSAIGQGASVREVVRESGLSHKRFVTLFTRAVGLTPKRFTRILRFRHLHDVARRTGHIDWARIAQECGYFDQAHLAAEFRKLTDMTPTEYSRGLARSRAVLDGHVAIS